MSPTGRARGSSSGASRYYRDSIDPTKLGYTYIFLGKDGAGRRLYQRQLDGEDVGRPVALLSYGEYQREIVRVRVELGPVVQPPSRWCAETRKDGTLTSVFDGWVLHEGL